MGLAQWPIFRAGFFRQAKYLVNTPQKAQSALEILETGVVGIEPLPMQTGFAKAPDKEVKKAWANIHALKFQVYKNGQPTDREAVLPISERSYKPLNPLGLLSEEEIGKLASLKDIAKVKYAQARAAVSGVNPHQDIASLIIQGGLILLGLALITKAC